MADITIEQARAIIAAARGQAAKFGVAVNIAVVDAGAHLKAFERMDGAILGSIDVAVKKARTARLFELETGDLGPLCQPGGPLASLEQTNGGLITFGGGAPVRNAAGEVVGAVGSSGTTVDQDHQIAQAGARALAP